MSLIFQLYESYGVEVSSPLFASFHFAIFSTRFLLDVFFTVDIFRELKENRPEPDPEKVVTIDEVEEVETQNFQAIEILRQLPGITDGNIRGVMEKVVTVTIIFNSNRKTKLV